MARNKNDAEHAHGQRDHACGVRSFGTAQEAPLNPASVRRELYSRSKQDKEKSSGGMRTWKIRFAGACPVGDSVQAPPQSYSPSDSATYLLTCRFYPAQSQIHIGVGIGSGVREPMPVVPHSRRSRVWNNRDPLLPRGTPEIANIRCVSLLLHLLFPAHAFLLTGYYEERLPMSLTYCEDTAFFYFGSHPAEQLGRLVAEIEREKKKDGENESGVRFNGAPPGGDVRVRGPSAGS